MNVVAAGGKVWRLSRGLRRDRTPPKLKPRGENRKARLSPGLCSPNWWAVQGSNL
ncbi:hypothetical protein [Lysobacter sp. CA199]|uniref:hypothetical protein n=1 Tax=Lysobacter sp. CA199 TaxID=3455608 RepID=UPI003F8D3755